MTPGGGAAPASLLARGVSSVTYGSRSSLLVGDEDLPFPVPLLTVVPSIEGFGLYSGEAPLLFGLGADIVGCVMVYLMYETWLLICEWE